MKFKSAKCINNFKQIREISFPRKKDLYGRYGLHAECVSRMAHLLPASPSMHAHNDDSQYTPFDHDPPGRGLCKILGSKVSAERHHRWVGQEAVLNFNEEFRDE